MAAYGWASEHDQPDRLALDKLVADPWRHYRTSSSARRSPTLSPNAPPTPHRTSTARSRPAARTPRPADEPTPSSAVLELDRRHRGDR
ncbi:hypothetical protein [Kitasatospora griseola]|uniref:hypothetical protein n=1 Tax=Kitasatospora griseola TaxID=2064 RepID=UPI00166FD755|nr:hypothetical protein [Kitasatospora griseola]